MRSRFLLITALLLVIVCGAYLGSASQAQQVTVGSPFNSLGDSFFERIGTNWNANWRGANFNFGQGNAAIPPFGGFNADAGLSGGFAFGGRGFNGALNFNAAQGYRQSFTTQTPSVTLMNGQTGFVSDTSQSPFVISFIPVVGGFPTVGFLNPVLPPPPLQTPGPSMAPAGNHRVDALRRSLAERQQGGEGPAARAARDLANAPARGAQKQAAPEKPEVPQAAVAAPSDTPAGKLAAAQASSAGRSAPSVAEARQMHEAQQAAGNQEVAALLERGRTAEDAGKPNVARIYYRMAAQRATGALKQQAQARLDSLGSTSTP